ncbi:MAG: sigma-70 family RNA polymerase sigma factor [Ruminococcus sp.]|nr:sigma-70 family RNA polymerase sigma factor [Ruminococcus sp.]
MEVSFSAKMQAERVIRQYADMIFRIALQNLKNKADAEDILQDVSLALLTKNAPLYDESHIKSWLIRVTLNKCKNFHKSAHRTKTEPLSDYVELCAKEDQRLLEDVMGLPKNYRNTLYLFYYEGYSIDEIAKLLNKKPSTVGSWLHRARKKLKTIILDGGNGCE